MSADIFAIKYKYIVQTPHGQKYYIDLLFAIFTGFAKIQSNGVTVIFIQRGLTKFDGNFVKPVKMANSKSI